MPIVRYEGISPVAGIPLTVYLQGTQQPATIYADPLLTPLSNPFNVDGVTGDYVFYADDQVAYDLQLGVGTGTPIPPVTPDPAPYDAAYLIANPTPYPALPNARSPQDSTSIEWDYSIPGRIRAVATSEPATSVSPISVAGLVGVSLDYARADHTHAGVPLAAPLVTWDSAPGLNGRQLIAGANISFTGGAGQLILNAVGSGFGDVTGPASAQNLHIAVFSGLSGKLIADGGATIAEVISTAVTGAQAAILPVNLATQVTGVLPFGNLTPITGPAVLGVPTGGPSPVSAIAGTDGQALVIAGGSAAFGQVDLTAGVIGDLPLANLAPSADAARLLGRGGAAGAGDWQPITLGTNLAFDGTTLNAEGGGGGAGLLQWVCVQNTLAPLGLGPSNAANSGTQTTIIAATGITSRIATAATLNAAASSQMNTLYLAPLPGFTADFYFVSPNDLTLMRMWVGIWGNVTPANSDTLTIQPTFSFRFSSAAGDVGWVPVTCDGSSNQTTGTGIGTVTPDTIYRLRIRVPAGATSAFFSVNGGAEQQITTTLPPTSTPFGWRLQLYTLSAAIRSFEIARVTILQGLTYP